MKTMPEWAACKHCGYRLRGLSEPRCPECGGAFDPENARSFVWDSRPRPTSSWATRLTVVAVVAAVCVVGVWHADRILGVQVHGPLHLLRCQSTGDKVAGAVLTLLLVSAMAAFWVWRHVGTFVLLLLGIMAWLGIGWIIAIIESV